MAGVAYSVHVQHLTYSTKYCPM